MYEVTSELYKECDYRSEKKPFLNDKNVVSEFRYKDLPDKPKLDVDGDLEVVRRKQSGFCNIIEIEHSFSTDLNLVGQQVWRGALLLADWLIANCENLPKDKLIVELGSGVGLSSIVAGMFRNVVCTDINLGDILKLIEVNVKRNSSVIKNDVKVLELDFKKDISYDIVKVFENCEIVLAADVIYDNTLTDHFISTLRKIVKIKPNKEIYIALEKRYVFTVADLDTCAPCFEYFIDQLRYTSELRFTELELNFPQYFQYERVPQLVMLRVTA